jgi:hypothetical protein
MTATFGELGVAVNAAAVAFCCALKQVLKNLAKFNPLRIF